MKQTLMIAGTLGCILSATGCIASHKYVAKVVAPVEARVATAEGKNADQDKSLASQGKQIDTLETNLSRTNEKVGDADAKAVAAQRAADRAQGAADGAQKSADGATRDAAGAQKTASGAQATADRGITHTDEVAKVLEDKVDAVNNFQMATSETVLFKLNEYTLDADAKAKLDEIASRATQNQRYTIEVQGFTDKTGSAEANAVLSQRRAESVSRYLINEKQIALRNIDMIGSGYAAPVADDKTRDGRKMNRRVEVRLFVPKMATASGTLSASTK